MPELPSGLNLAISRLALIDPGRNWFRCPDGHFWYWVPDPELGAPPFELDAEILQVPEHAPVPSNRKEVKRFIQVLEMDEDGRYAWRGEWLSHFPRYTDLDEADLSAWLDWLDVPERTEFLNETIVKCEQLAEKAKRATGYAVFENVGEADEDGWRSGELRNPASYN